MLQLKFFPYNSADEANQFIADHVIPESGIRTFPDGAVVFYEAGDGLSPSDQLAILTKQLRTLQQNLLSLEQSRRFWLSKTVIHKTNKQDEQANAQLTAAGKQIDDVQLDIRTTKGLIEAIRKGEFLA